MQKSQFGPGLTALKKSSSAGDPENPVQQPSGWGRRNYAKYSNAGETRRDGEETTNLLHRIDQVWFYRNMILGNLHSANPERDYHPAEQLVVYLSRCEESRSTDPRDKLLCPHRTPGGKRRLDVA